jgi:hypothetical protein
MTRHVLLLMTLTSCGASAPQQAPARSPATLAVPARGSKMISPPYPNVHARLRLTQHIPGDPDRHNEIEIWLKDTRFHVRELTGRRLDEILADATAPRRLGAQPRTIEDMMDREDNRERAGTPSPPIDLYGELRTDDGWAFQPLRDGRERGPVRASKFAPVAEQILAHGKDHGLTAGPRATRLGRATTEYRGVETVIDNAKQFQITVTRAIALPYVLLDEARSANDPELGYVREVVLLEEGTVTDADVTPPPS